MQTPRQRQWTHHFKDSPTGVDAFDDFSPEKKASPLKLSATRNGLTAPLSPVENVSSSQRGSILTIIAVFFVSALALISQSYRYRVDVFSHPAHPQSSVNYSDNYPAVAVAPVEEASSEPSLSELPPCEAKETRICCAKRLLNPLARKFCCELGQEHLTLDTVKEFKELQSLVEACELATCPC